MEFTMAETLTLLVMVYMLLYSCSFDFVLYGLTNPLYTLPLNQNILDFSDLTWKLEIKQQEI